MGQASKRGVSGSICVFEKYIVQALLLYSLNPKFYMGKRYKCIQISHFASASGGLRPQAPYRDFAPRSHWGPSVPDSSWPGPHHVTVNPSIVKSWIRLWGNENNRWNGQNCVYRAVNVISFRGGGLPSVPCPNFYHQTDVHVYLHARLKHHHPSIDCWPFSAVLPSPQLANAAVQIFRHSAPSWLRFDRPPFPVPVTSASRFRRCSPN